ncbi:MAG: histidine phosphatase family protein [Candidatus Kerfeldbacteria bacterium]|nr:histidine phosphatase family protein [Candidatus Kerfeldbacteria bacterium]
MSTFYLVRHVQYSNSEKISPGRLPLELSEHGIEQARILQQFFQDKHIETIYSSPVLRCKQTAEIIAASTIPIHYDIRLAEIFSANQGNREIDNWRKALYEFVPTLGGESPQDVQQRMIDFWATTLFESDKNYIICSHGDPLFFLYQFLCQQPLHDDLTVNQPEGYQPKASVRIVEYTDGNTVIVHPYITNQQL